MSKAASPTSVQDIMHLLNAYTQAITDFVLKGDAGIEAAFKPLQAALVALVEENHRLKFELDGVNAMRWPLTDEKACEIIEQVGDSNAKYAWDYSHMNLVRAVEAAHGIAPEQGEVES